MSSFQDFSRSPSVYVSWQDTGYSYCNLFFGTDATFATYTKSVTGYTGSSYTFSELSPGTTYYCKIIPYNALGVAGTATTVTIAATPTINKAYVSTVDNSAATVIWGGVYDAVDISVNVAGLDAAAQTSYKKTFSDLSGNQQYIFTVVPRAADGTRYTAGAATATAFTAVQPVSGATYSYDSSSVTVVYTVGKNSGTPVYQQRLVAWDSLYADASAAGVTTLSILGLPGNTTFLAAVKTVIDANSAVTGNTVFTLPVQSPTGVTYSYDSSSVLVSYTAARNTGDTTYNSLVYTAGNSAVFANTLGEGTSLRVSGLTGNQAYNFKVKTVAGSYGNSAVTGNVSFYTAVQPAKSVAYTVDSSSIKADFTAGTNTGTPTYWQYLYYGGVVDSSASSSTTATAVYSLSGNTTYIANIVTNIGGNIAAAGNVSLTTDIQWPQNLSVVSYDTSSITVSFSARNSYGTTLEYIASATTTNMVGGNASVTVSSSPAQVTGLYSGQPYYISVTTVIDSSGTAVSKTTAYQVTSIEAATISPTVDSSAVYLYFTGGRNVGTAIYTPYCLSGGTVAAGTRASVSSSPAMVTGLYGNAPYVVWLDTSMGVGNIYSSSTTVATNVQSANTQTTSYDSSSVTVSFYQGYNLNTVRYKLNVYDNTTGSLIKDISYTVLGTENGQTSLSLSDFSGNNQYVVELVTYGLLAPATITSTTKTSSSITVNFTGGSNTFATSGLYYRANCYAGGVSITNTGTVSPITVTDLSSLTSYTVSVDTIYYGNTATSAAQSVTTL